MKYKIAICDDSGADRQYVLNMVRAWAAPAGHTVHIDDFPSAESGTHAELVAKDGVYKRFTEIREKAEGWRIAAE